MGYRSFIWRLCTALCCLAFLACAAGAPSNAAPAKKQVLVVSVTKGTRHSSIPLGEEIIKNLGDKSGLWETTYARTDEELQKLTTADALKSFDLVLFNNTTGDIPLADRQAFLNWVRAGGNVAGIHAATDTLHSWPEYIDMIGGEFEGHGRQLEVEFLVQDPSHPAAKGLPKIFKAKEEVYLFKNFSPDKVRVLLALNKHPNTYLPGYYPISWVRMYGKGRVFYTALGHREDLLGSDVVQKHILGGMRWALGLAKGSADPLHPRVSDTKKVLVTSITKGHHHSTIPLGEEIIKGLGDQSGLWETTFARTDEELQKLTTPAALKSFDLLFFNNTSGDIPLADRQVFINWVKAGGNVAGIHGATDTFHGWPEFVDMIGGEFIGHGDQMEVEYLIQDPNHPATKGLPRRFKAPEEVYHFGRFSWDKVRVLIALDKHPNTFLPGAYPVSWVRNYGKGRVFYTSIGHREDLLQNDTVQKHILGGMRWALGLAYGKAEPLSPQPVSAAEKKEGFRAIFNAKDLTGWHVRIEGRKPWTVQNGMLVMGESGGADFITDEKFGDFILRYEYMLPKGGNSGVYLRGRYEIQALDDLDRQKPTESGNGSIYGEITPRYFVTRPPGQWQSVEAKLVGGRLTVILNGVKTIDDQPVDNPTRGALDDLVEGPGPIMLQGDHGPVAYRNIRIKPL